MTGTPPAEHSVDEQLARRLLADQHPDLAELPLAPAASGFDNVMFRLGTDLAVRLPRRDAAAGLAATEHRWLPGLAPSLPLPVPVPVRVGVPGRGYPWPWSVVRWLDGTPAEVTPVSDAEDAAGRLADFLTALHRPAPPDAPSNPWRGIPLADRLERTVATIDRLAATEIGQQIDLAAVTADVTACARRPRWQHAPVWLHGDLHARHVLVVDGTIGGIIDFGDLTAGDPATDLAAVWMVLPLQAHARFRERYDTDDDTWERARGWALVFGAILAEVGVGDDDRARVDGAITTLRRALQG